MKTLVMALILVSAAFAQEAVVVELSPADAVAAKKAYEAKQSADKAWDDLYAKIQKAHASEGMVAGVQFSKDFRFIVPLVDRGTTLTYSGSSGGITLQGCGSTLQGTPAPYWINPTSGTLRIDPPYFSGTSTNLLPATTGVIDTGLLPSMR